MAETRHAPGPTKAILTYPREPKDEVSVGVRSKREYLTKYWLGSSGFCCRLSSSVEYLPSSWPLTSPVKEALKPPLAGTGVHTEALWTSIT